MSNSSHELSQSTFQGNGAGIVSAVFAEINSTIYIDDSTFLFNNGSRSGPGHTLFATDDCLIVTQNSTFSHNNGEHGVFGVINGLIEVYSSSFSLNGALHCHGGVCTTHGHSSFLLIMECTLTHNFAQVRG